MHSRSSQSSTNFACVQVDFSVGQSLTASTTPWGRNPPPEMGVVRDFFSHGYVVTGQRETEEGIPASGGFLFGTMFSRFERAIAASGAMAELADDWDGDGALAPAAHSLKTAQEFALRMARLAAGVGLLEHLAVPTFTPGPGRSVDTHWRRAEYEFLVNFPDQHAGIASFYADNHAQQTLKGVQSYVVAADLLARWLLGVLR